MSWLITGAGGHAEAREWKTRVTANSGTVSNSTLFAVSDFCAAIDQTPGLRAAITRLNLFCGDNLNAALVPLYLAESLGAAAKGNTTDTNFSFVAGDYAASGASGGFTGNGSTKYLDTGLSPSQTGTQTSGHLSFSGTGYKVSPLNEATAAMGSATSNADSTVDDFIINVDLGAGNTGRTIHRRGGFSAGGRQLSSSSYGHIIGSTISATSRTLYVNGTSIDTQTSSVTASRTGSATYFIFATNAGTSASPIAAVHTAARQRMYSIGAGLTASQAAAFSFAVATFNAALGRT